MRAAIPWLVVVLIVVHGAIHLLGAAKGLGWGDVAQLRREIGPATGAAWLATSLLVMSAGILLAASVRWWWVVGGVAVLASQAIIFSAWEDARAGTLVNVVLLLAVVHGAAAEGPTSLRAEYREHLARAGEEITRPRTVTESDLSHLPELVADYVRRSGAVGRPRVDNIRVEIHGRIRSGRDEPWMRFEGEQVNTYRPHLRRSFLIDATRMGMPVDVLHTFTGSDGATMRVRLLSLLQLQEASGPEMDRAETVTLFNDMCLFAPAALVDAPVRWAPVDDRRVRGTFTHGDDTVAATLVFDEADDLVDFVSDDRLRASDDGSEFTRQRWSTPVSGHREYDGRRIPSYGEGRWHAPAPEGEFSYLEIAVDDLLVNIGSDGTPK